MKHLILFVQLLVVTTLLSAQNIKTKTTYFDASWKQVKNEKKATYYRETKFERDTLFVVDYYINGTKQMVGQYSDRKGEIRAGLFTYFYEVGNKKSEGNYKNDKYEGAWMYWDSTGKLSQNGMFVNDNREGVWFCYYPSGKISEEVTYSNDTIIKVKSLKEDGTELTEKDTFRIVDQMPMYPGGQEAMMRFLSTNIKYPAKARENGIEGRVVLQFIIDKTGYLCEIEILKSPSEELEKETIRVVGMMPDWMPGKQNKVPVAVRFILPVVFRLN